MWLQISSFFCWDLATGAKIIGSLGVLKHSLTILLIYLETIDLWVLSNTVNGQKIPTLVYTFVVILLFVAFIVNVFNIILAYRLFKITDTNQVQDLTNWIITNRIYLLLFVIYICLKFAQEPIDFRSIIRVLTFIFDVYCNLCVVALREDYRKRASLLGYQA